MSFGDLTRINTNVQAGQALANLQRTNSELGMRQLRLSTGSRINRAEDDSAGYSIAKKLEATVRGQAQALANVGDAKSMLTVAEGSLNSVTDILLTMKEKTIQAANGTMGTDERAAIQNQLDALATEVEDILGGAQFNGINLFGEAVDDDVTLSFQVGAGSADTFSVTLSGLRGANLFVDDDADPVTLDVEDIENIAETMDAIDAAIATVSEELASVGDSQSRLTFKQDNLLTSMNNYESARSRIADADFAREQMQIVKLQILQQTGTASLAQANAAPQSVFALF